MNNYPTEVMEVHNEFMTAGDTLLKKAEEILKTEVKINPAKIARLQSFGFKSSKDATALEDDKKEKTHQQKIVEAINYYRVKFPNYKFIPKETVKSICEKYGLVSGEAHQYKGFVPEKNLSEIERFFEVYPDMRFAYFKTSSRSGLYSWFTPDTQIEKDEYDEIMAKQPKAPVQSFAKGLDKEITGKSIFEPYQERQYLMGYDPIGTGTMFGRDLMSTYETMFRSIQIPSDYYGIRDAESKNPTATKKETTLRICAPATEMNTDGYELEAGYKLVYDPIVSIELTHKNGIKGEIILTAWGDEASDELVIDQNKN